MKKINKENLNRIQEYEESILTTKELKDLGLTPYQIKLYLENGYFEKIGFGKYKITIIRKRDSINEDYIRGLFKDMRLLIENGEYEKANIILIHICEDKTTNTFDGDIYIILNILKNIIGYNRDYNYANNLKFKKSSLSASDLAIYNGEYLDAKKKYFDLYAIESNHDLGVGDITSIKYTLLNETMKRVESGLCPELRVNLARNFYSSFIEFVRARNHKLALQELEKCISYTDDKDLLDIYLMLKEATKTIVDYVKIHKDNFNVINRECGTNPLKSLNEAIYKHDFIYAYFIMNEFEIGDQKKYKSLKNLIRGLLKICGKYQDYLDFWNDNHKDSNELSGYLLEEKNIGEIKKSRIRQEETLINNNYLKKRYENKYVVLDKYINEKDYEGALSYLRVVICEDIKTDDYKIYKLISFLHFMESNKVGFNECSIDYAGLSLEELFEKAILEDDYYIAFRNIGKITYNNSSSSLALMKKILHKMYEINKKYAISKKEVNLEKQKEGELETLAKVEEINVLDNEDPVHLVTEKVDSELNEEYIPYSYDELYESLDEGNFDSVLASLKVGYKRKVLNRLETNTYRLLMILYHYKSGTLNEDIREVEETNDFANFYQALKYHRVADIIKYYEIAYDGAYDRSEFEIYGFVVKEIQRIYEGKKKVEPYNEIIKSLLDGKEMLTGGEIAELFNLLDYKCEYDLVSGYIEYVILEMIDLLVKNETIDATYFMNYKSESLLSEDKQLYSVELPNVENENVDKMIDTLLENGDFINAYSLIYKTPFGACLKKYKTNDKIIIRSLLKIFNNLVNRERVVSSQVTSKEEELKRIKGLIKRNDFVGALKAVFAASHVDEYLLVEILDAIITMHVGSYILERASYDDFREAIKKKDLERARIAIIDYEEMIKHFLCTKKYQENVTNMQSIYAEKQNEKQKETQKQRLRKKK